MTEPKIAPRKKKMKRCKEDVIFDTVVFIVLTLILLIVAYPLYWVVISSISDPSAVSGGAAAPTVSSRAWASRCRRPITPCGLTSTSGRSRRHWAMI